MTKPKLKIVKRSVKHEFTPEEIAALNVEFGGAYDAVQSVTADFDSIKAVHKAKITEAESRMTTLRCRINAGFENREKPCVRILDLAKGKKYFFLETDIHPETGLVLNPDKPVITEDLTDADRQQELLEAEEAFENRENIELFKPAGQDVGTLTVGRLNGKWFSALRVTIGKNTVKERLDGEQKTTKGRPDAVKQGVKRFTAWVEEQLGKEPAKGFTNAANLVIAEHAEREE